MKDLITNLMEEIRVQYLAYDVVLGADEVYEIALKRLTGSTKYV